MQEEDGEVVAHPDGSEQSDERLHLLGRADAGHAEPSERVGDEQLDAALDDELPQLAPQALVGEREVAPWLFEEDDVREEVGLALPVPVLTERLDLVAETISRPFVLDEGYADGLGPDRYAEPRFTILVGIPPLGPQVRRSVDRQRRLTGTPGPVEEADVVDRRLLAGE